MSSFDFQSSLSTIQRLLLRVYIVGFGLMVLFNWGCYPGSLVGVFGWAAIWPIYIPATLVSLLITGDTLGVNHICPGPMMNGLR
jgi:hypothetical protein